MNDTSPFTKEELDDLVKYIYITLPSFDEEYLCNESSSDYVCLGSLRQRINAISDKLRLLSSDSH